MRLFEWYRLKILVPVITIVLALLLGLMLWQDYKDRTAAEEAAAEYERQIIPLNLKLRELEQELTDLEIAYEEARTPKATAQIVFPELDARVYELCYPAMSKHGFTGVLALSSFEFPGMDGCMSISQFQELLDAGWTTCILYNGVADVKTWWTSLSADLKRMHISVPSALYCPDGLYATSYESDWVGFDFSTIIYEGPDDTSVIQTSDENGIWHLGAVGLMSRRPKVLLEEAVSLKGNLAFLVGFTDEAELYNEKSFLNMLAYLSSYSANGDLIVTSPDDARAHFQSRGSEASEAETQAYLMERAEIEKKIEDVKKEMRELNASGD